jgi:hypothetical protein
MTIRRLVFGLLACAMIGCYSTPEGFARRASKLDCKRFEKCAKAQFDAQFDSLSDCRDEFRDNAEEAIDDLEDAGCDYQPDEGRDCIHESYQQRNDCSDSASSSIADACREIFECPGGLERAPEDEGAGSIVDAMLATMPPDDE